MNQLMKRVLSVLLVVCLLCSALPSAFAAESGGFTDVSKDHWAYDAITEAVAAGYFKGVSDTAFDPEGTLTRAMLVTVLARAAGAETDDNASTGFSDVAAGTWYTGAVAWAAENGVVTPVLPRAEIKLRRRRHVCPGPRGHPAGDCHHLPAAAEAAEQDPPRDRGG